MKLVSVRASTIVAYQEDGEVLQKSSRPYVLVVRLKYKGHNYDFAIPLRSNIPANAPKNQYFALPPRKTTRPKNRHGLHYIKMFPVRRRDLLRYRTEGNKFASLVQEIIDRNAKQIIAEAQSYLYGIECGNAPRFATNIDWLLAKMKELDAE